MSCHAIRLAALTGAAAVALGVATPVVAAAAERTATVHTVAATATPVRHAGRTVTVVMPTTHYTATTSHRDAVVTLAAAGPTALPADTITGQQGTGTTITPAYQEKVSATGGTIAIGTTATLLLLVIVGFAVKNGRVKLTWAVLSAALGVLLAGTIFGTLSEQLSGTVVASLNSILSSL